MSVWCQGLRELFVLVMGNKQVKQHFENAKKTGVLKISLMRLCDFPPQLRDFPNVLRTLDISENKFVRIPEDIGKFTLLKHLNLNSNKLEELPEALGKLIKLETLTAMNNYIPSIPSSLSALKHLKQVNLSNNLITVFPVMFCGLKNLDVLDLSRNRITKVPPEAKDLYVIELNLNQNQVAQVAEELAQCTRMKTLRLEENCLQIAAVPSKLLRESQVANLALDGNLFSSKELTNLDGYDVYMERYTSVRRKLE